MEIKLNLRKEFHDHQGAVREIRVRPDGKLFLARSDDMLVLYDLDEGRKLRGFYDSAGYDGAAFGPEGNTLLYMSDEKIHYWDLAIWRERMVLRGELFESRDTDAHIGIGLWADGGVSGSIAVRRLDADEGEPPEFTLEGHTSYIEYVCFHPSGKFLASGAADKTIRFWNLEAQSEVSNMRVHDDSVTAIGFSPDGKTMISGDYSGCLKVWDLTVG